MGASQVRLSPINVDFDRLGDGCNFLPNCLGGRFAVIREAYSNLLYLGNAVEARNLKLLYDREIRVVIDLAINEKPAQLGRDLIYCRFPMCDGAGNSDAIICLALQTIVSALQSQLRTLVACSAGMSRAPVFAAVSLALFQANAPEQCLLDIISDGPNDVSPILWADVLRIYNTLRQEN